MKKISRLWILLAYPVASLIGGAVGFYVFYADTIPIGFNDVIAYAMIAAPFSQLLNGLSTIGMFFEVADIPYGLAGIAVPVFGILFLKKKQYLYLLLFGLAIAVLSLHSVYTFGAMASV